MKFKAYGKYRTDRLQTSEAEFTRTENTTAQRSPKDRGSQPEIANWRFCIWYAYQIVSVRSAQCLKPGAVDALTPKKLLFEGRYIPSNDGRFPQLHLR
jgi:hypothetical protein